MREIVRRERHERHLLLGAEIKRCNTPKKKKVTFVKVLFLYNANKVVGARKISLSVILPTGPLELGM